MKNFSSKINILLFLSILCLFSCGKDDDVDDMLPTQSEGSEYMPLSSGSWRMYEETTVFNDTINYTLTVSDETETFHGKTFSIINADLTGIEPGYMRCENGDCYAIINSFVVDGMPEWLFLKSDVAVGETWEFDYTYYGNPNKYVMEVIAVNETHTVKGQSYSDVIQIERRHQSREASGAWSNLEEGLVETTWHAKGIGLIQSTSAFGTGRFLIDYDIK